MSDVQSIKTDKLSAARKKLKEFQEQKKLREKNRASPGVLSENIGHSNSEEQAHHHTTHTNNENIAPQQQNVNNVNIAQYFMPNTQESFIKNDQHSANDQGFFNQPFINSNVQDSFQIQPNSNPNSSVNMQAYFSDNIFQPDHSIENNNFVTNVEPVTYSQAGSNIQNVNKLDNVTSDNNTGSNSENNIYQYQKMVHPSPESNKMSTFSANENNSIVPGMGSAASPKDTGNTNSNILSVFTDSSTSSHTSSTHTGPFLLNEESPQLLNNETSPKQVDDKGGNDASTQNESYHLFEQTHNENYFGINFGNDQGPGIHMNVNPFEHRNEKLVTDFLECESRPEQTITHPQESPSDESKVESQDNPPVDSNVEPTINPNTPINLLNDTFRRNLLSLSTSKSTSVEEYTDKSTRGNSTVSKSVSLESSAGGGAGERGGVYCDDISNSSTVFSSCDNLRKLLSSAAESSSEPPCTNSQCEEACVLEELRASLATEQEKNGELKALLTGEQGKTSGLEAQVNQLRNELHSIHSNQTDALKHYAQESDQLHAQLKSQTHTIQILIEEKTQLDDKVKSLGHIVEEKGKEIEELKGRLAISKHKSANIERDVGLLQEQVKQSGRAWNEINEMLTQERKQLEELAEDKTALVHKLDTKSQELQQAQILLQERDSQLSLMHLKVQQLSAANGMFSSNELSDVQYLQQERDQLKAAVLELSEQMKTLTRERDKTLEYHGHMIDTLKAKNEELTNLYSSLNTERTSLHSQCQSQISHIAELERQMQALRANHQAQERAADSEESVLKPLVAEMETKIKDLTMDRQQLDTALQAQVLETELAQERVEQLSREIERLESDRPDANALLSAMESDKIAASRAIQQNSALKQQLQELQDALITLNNAKLELSEQLIQEQTQSKHLKDNLDSLLSQLNQQQALQGQDEIENSLQSDSTPNDIASQTLEYPASSLNQTSAYPASSVNQTSAVDEKALRLLEDKFNSAMRDVAELSDEKQRLEHLVTQLQLETETIGEYAALYQKQRYLLQQKAREKDEQVKQLSEDQEALKQKLAKLNALVQEFVTQGTVSVKDALLESSEKDGASSPHSPISPPVETKASQIMELISEIEANRLVVPSSFHPCPVCSGQLITV